MELMIRKNFINNEDLIPIAITAHKTVNSFLKGYYVYKDLWKPCLSEELTTALELDNDVDKYTLWCKKERCHSRTFT